MKTVKETVFFLEEKIGAHRVELAGLAVSFAKKPSADLRERILQLDQIIASYIRTLKFIQE